MDAFKFSKINSGNSDIYILTYEPFDIESHFDVLTPDELERCLGFGHIKRKREFVATRILRHSIFGFQHIHYNANGAPFIHNGSFISISHCGNTVAIAVNPDFAIGLDLEVPRENIQTIMHKFLSEKEIELFDCADALVVSKVWSCKEALYKLAGRKQILFSSELHLEPLTDLEWKGRIINDDHELHVNLNIFEQHDLIITINNKPVERIESNS